MSISFLRWKSFNFFMICSPLNGGFKTSKEGRNCYII
jgi:hypothetical protein